ncbi:MAG: ParA family protein [Desertifilum sp.]|nr:ParA family protein [Desertifilum sp.]
MAKIQSELLYMFSTELNYGEIKLSIILCTQHKGGAGKTTLAVHMAGILTTQLNRILLIDCDTQRNAWFFYLRDKAQSPLEMQEYNDRLSIIWNPEREPIRRIADIQTYDHIILDMSTPLPDTVKVIVDNDPDVILVPVSKHPWAIEGLSDTLPVISKLEEVAGFTPDVIIVPLGSSKQVINEKVQNISKLPINYKIANRMRDLNKEVDKALNEGNLLWSYSGLEKLSTYFSSLLS